MGIDVNVNVNFSPLRIELVQNMQAAAQAAQAAQAVQAPAQAVQAPAQADHVRTETETETEPEAAPKPKREPAPLPEAPKAVETPEEAVKKLLQGFGIPAVKEDRTEDQQKMAKAMNRGLKELIQIVTHNGAARSIADLRTDDQKAEFVKLAMLMEYDAATKSFISNPF